MKSDNESSVSPMKSPARASDLIKTIVSRFSRGNVNLQQGRYLTQEAQNARKKSLDQYDFLS